MPRYQAMSILFLCVTGLLEACGTSNSATIASTTKGTVIYPPAAGKAYFSAVIDGQVSDITSADVSKYGEYNLALPTSPPLPTTANIHTLYQTVIGLPSTFESLQCMGQPSISDLGAKTVLLNGGRYVVGSQQTGRLGLLAGLLGGEFRPQDVTQTLSTQVYTDRDVNVVGILKCTITLTKGSTLSGQSEINYSLKHGWNLIETRTEQLDAANPIVIKSTSVALSGITWRYIPSLP